MTLHLTSGDQTRLNTSLQTLLSPLSHDSVEDWTLAVSAAIQHLLGAEKAAFLVLDQEFFISYSDEIEAVILRQVGNHYFEQLPLHLDMDSMWERAASLRVYDSDLIWQPCRDAFLSSAYYQELLRPLRLQNAISMMDVRLEDRFPQYMYQVVVCRDAPGAPPFGERGLALLRLLYTAFTSGVKTHRRFHEQRASFLRTLDATGQCLQLCDLAGRVVHHTPALSQLLHKDPDHALLEQEMARVARALVDLCRGKVHAGTAPIQREVQTRQASYHLWSTYVGEPRPDGDSLVLVTVERLTPELPSVCDLQERFGLTKRQAETALLLAQGLFNDEIADRMCISPHTARHHTEAVLRKLGLNARAEVMQAILS